MIIRRPIRARRSFSLSLAPGRATIRRAPTMKIRI